MRNGSVNAARSSGDESRTETYACAIRGPGSLLIQRLHIFQIIETLLLCCLLLFTFFFLFSSFCPPPSLCTCSLRWR